MADIDAGEVFDAAMECEGIYVTDGQQGVDNLKLMAEMLGYKDAWHNPLESMLRDNSGMIEAMIDWARENCSPEQAERLESYIPEDHEFEDTTQVIPNSPEVQRQLNVIIDEFIRNKRQ